MKKKKIMLFISVFLLISAVPVKAERFWATGTIKRTLSEGDNYGGCMILLSKNIGHGCREAWVSLDCKGVHFEPSVGSRNYASAIVAASTGKQVSVFVDSSKKFNNYCFAPRLDIKF